MCTSQAQSSEGLNNNLRNKFKRVNLHMFPLVIMMEKNVNLFLQISQLLFCAYDTGSERNTNWNEVSEEEKQR